MLAVIFLCRRIISNADMDGITVRRVAHFPTKLYMPWSESKKACYKTSSQQNHR